MKTKEQMLKEILRNDPFGLLGEKTLPIESRELLIQHVSFALNSVVWETLKDFIVCEKGLTNVEINPDSTIWNEIEEFIADKIFEDNGIKIVE